MKLAEMVQDAMIEGTALEKFRRKLSDEDRTALDALCSELREYVGIGLMCSFSTFEEVLLLMLVKQQRKIACLEFLLRRNVARMLTQ